MPESITEFMERRRREIAQFGRNAEAAAHDAYGKAIRAEQNLKLGSPGEVMRYGAELLRRPSGAATELGPTATPQRRGASSPASSSALRAWLDNSPEAKSFAGDVARDVGNVVGVVRGGVHAVEGLVDGATFLGRLANPLDRYVSPPGRSAAEQLVDAGRGVADYVRNGVADPQSVVNDVKAKAHQMRTELDPSATAVAPTLAGELRRNFDIGQNQGELAFDVGSLVVGGPAAKAVKGLGRVSNVGNAEKYLAQGFSRTPRRTISSAEHGPSLHPAIGRASEEL